MTTRTDEAAEAINGGLHESGFQAVGDVMGTNGVFGTYGLHSYWHIGRAPEDIRVIVMRSEPFVIVRVEWRILAMRPVKKATLTLSIDCSPDNARDSIVEATTGVVHKCLEVFKDVLERKGYASKLYHDTHVAPPTSTP